MAKKLVEVEDVTQTDALAGAMAAKVAKVVTKALVQSVANTLAKVKAFTFGDMLRAVHSH